MIMAAYNQIDRSLPVSGDLLLMAGVGIAGYLLIKKVGTSLTLFKTDAQVKAEKNAANAIAANIDAVRATQKTTKPDGEWASIAELIYRDLRYSATSDNDGDAVYQTCRVKNDADFWTLFKFFGRRQETWFGVIPDGDPKDLIQMLKTNLSSAHIATINNNFSRKQMKVSL